MTYDVPSPFPPPQQPWAAPAAGTPGAVPLDQPLYGATFGQAMRRFFAKYASFDGRASRSEYWWVALGMGGISFVMYLLVIVASIASADPVTGELDSPLPVLVFGLVWVTWTLIVFVPALALAVRRLHDTGRSGWFYLLVFVPFGSIVVLVFLASVSTPSGLQFDPRRGSGDAVMHPSLGGFAGGAGYGYAFAGQTAAPGPWGAPPPQPGYGPGPYAAPQDAGPYGAAPTDAPGWPEDRYR